MSTITSKIQLATAVFAVAATATLTPVALADDTDSTSTDSATASVGSAAGTAPTRSTRKDRPLPTSQSGGTQASGSTGSTSGSTSSTDTATTEPDRASTSVDVTEPTTGANAAAPSAVGQNPLFQNPLIWIGQPNPNPPVGTTIYQFQPLGNLPEFTRPMFGWMQGFDFEACVLGVGTTVNGQTVVGPYGTSTTGVSSSGCA